MGQTLALEVKEYPDQEGTQTRRSVQEKCTYRIIAHPEDPYFYTIQSETFEVDVPILPDTAKTLYDAIINNREEAVYVELSEGKYPAEINYKYKTQELIFRNFPVRYKVTDSLLSLFDKLYTTEFNQAISAKPVTLSADNISATFQPTLNFSNLYIVTPSARIFLPDFKLAYDLINQIKGFPHRDWDVQDKNFPTFVRFHELVDLRYDSQTGEIITSEWNLIIPVCRDLTSLLQEIFSRGYSQYGY